MRTLEISTGVSASGSKKTGSPSRGSRRTSRRTVALLLERVLHELRQRGLAAAGLVGASCRLGLDSWTRVGLHGQPKHAARLGSQWGTPFDPGDRAPLSGVLCAVPRETESPPRPSLRCRLIVASPWTTVTARRPSLGDGRRAANPSSEAGDDRIGLDRRARRCRSIHSALVRMVESVAEGTARLLDHGTSRPPGRACATSERRSFSTLNVRNACALHPKPVLPRIPFAVGIGGTGDRNLTLESLGGYRSAAWAPSLPAERLPPATVLFSLTRYSRLCRHGLAESRWKAR